jgi:transposase
MRYALNDNEWRVIQPMLPQQAARRAACGRSPRSQRPAHRHEIRYKLAVNYRAFVKLASSRLWLRVYESTPWSVLNATS